MHYPGILRDKIRCRYKEITKQSKKKIQRNLSRTWLKRILCRVFGTRRQFFNTYYKNPDTCGRGLELLKQSIKTSLTLQTKNEKNKK